ncbi:choice-of-anchor C family protein [Streptomyces sp. B1866]|uniref:choice-of-anchor C family protein n=1 Tax=Streptomyces sp. B1866 TaxID=3075431 RepID=UPI00288D09AE|nr:choice-of-anchor C family protein [Streptomyces sp. B1866]MDT3397775.1 choice-of-anchor C family protein [Streptomyces sp. B1866]
MVALRTYAIALATAGLIAAGGGTALAAPAGGTDTAGSATAAVSRFDDGSFEYPLAPANRFTTYAAGQSIGPWRVGAGGVDLIGAGFWQAAEGDQSVDLNSGNPGSVAQTFTTTPGRAYTVTYALAGNTGGAHGPNNPVVKTGRVLLDGQVFQDFSFDVSNATTADMGYVRRQVTFEASRATTTLTFASTTPGAYGPAIDDVRVSTCCSCACPG